MTRVRGSGLVVLLVAASASAAPGQSVRGTLTSDSTAVPVAGAPVELVGSDGRAKDTTVTDATGAFALRPPSGGYWIRIAAPGFQIVESRAFYLGRGDSLTLVLTTRPVTTLLTGVTVSATSTQNRRLAGFLQREKVGFGRYFDPEFVQRARVSMASELLDGLTPGLVSRPREPVRFTNRGRNCYPTIIVDGSAYGRPIPVEELVIGSEIVAVEVYTQPALVPPELSLQPFNNCGAVVIWTRFGLGSP